MFFCERCRMIRKWPESIRKDIGNCEICGKSVLCNDAPDELWTMKNGTKIKVGDMTETHAKNTLRMLIRSHRLKIAGEEQWAQWEKEFWDEESDAYGSD